MPGVLPIDVLKSPRRVTEPKERRNSALLVGPYAISLLLLFNLHCCSCGSSSRYLVITFYSPFLQSFRRKLTGPVSATTENGLWSTAAIMYQAGLEHHCGGPRFECMRAHRSGSHTRWPQAVMDSIERNRVLKTWVMLIMLTHWCKGICQGLARKNDCVKNKWNWSLIGFIWYEKL